jgi:hypothetical protein
MIDITKIKACEVKSLPIKPDYSKEHFAAVQQYIRHTGGNRPNIEDGEEETERDSRFVPIEELMTCETHFERWCTEEEKVMNKMAYYNIQKVIKKMNRRRMWNEWLRGLKIPFRFNVHKYQDIYNQYLGEYMLRTSKTYGFGGEGQIEYDLYRGLKPKEFHLDMNVYKEKYAQIMEKKKKDQPTLGLFFKYRVKRLLRLGV